MTGKDPLPIDRVNAFWRLDQAMRSLLERVLPVADRPVGFEHNLPTPLMQEPQLDEALNEIFVDYGSPNAALDRLLTAYTSLTSGSSNARLAVRAGRLTVGVREPVGRRETIRGLENLTFDLGPGALDALDRDVVGPSRFLAWNATGHIPVALWLGPTRYLRVGCRACANCVAAAGARRGLPHGVSADAVKASRRIRANEELVVEHWDGRPECECPSVPSREEDEDFYEAFDAPRSPVYSEYAPSEGRSRGSGDEAGVSRKRKRSARPSNVQHRKRSAQRSRSEQGVEPHTKTATRCSSRSPRRTVESSSSFDTEDTRGSTPRPPPRRRLATASSSESDRDDASRRPRTPRHPSPLIQASSSEADKETGERNITVFTSPLSACPSESDIPVLPNEHPPTDNDVLSFELDPFWERELNGPRLDQQKEVEPGARGEEQDRQRCAERREEQGEHRDTNAMDNFAPVPELSQPSPAPSSSSDFIEWLPTFPDAPPSVPLLRSNVDPRSICPWHLPTSRHIPPVSPRGRGLRKLRRIVALDRADADRGRRWRKRKRRRAFMDALATQRSESRSTEECGPYWWTRLEPLRTARERKRQRVESRVRWRAYKAQRDDLGGAARCSATRCASVHPRLHVDRV